MLFIDSNFPYQQRQIHQIQFESVHNVMKIDIMSNCLVVCNPRSNIIYKKITQHLPWPTSMQYISVLYSLDSILFGVSKNSVVYYIYKHHLAASM